MVHNLNWWYDINITGDMSGTTITFLLDLEISNSKGWNYKNVDGAANELLNHALNVAYYEILIYLSC